MTETDFVTHLREFRDQVFAKMDIPAGNYCAIHACQAQTGEKSICMKIRVELDQHNTMREMLSNGEVLDTVLECQQDDCQADSYCGEHCGGRFFFWHIPDDFYLAQGKVICADCMRLEVQEEDQFLLDFVPIDQNFRYPKVDRNKSPGKKSKTDDSASDEQD
jgi:hypothetical protein